MKTVKILFFTLLASMFFTTATFALSKSVMPNPEALLRAELTTLIGQPDTWVFGSKKSIEANIEIMVNSDNEIILVNSGTDSPKLAKYMKRKLNNKKIKTENIPANKSYFLKVSFKK